MEFISVNDSTDAFYHRNLRYYVCQACTYSDNCRQGDEMPIVSPLSRYILRWHAEQKIVPGYPLPGNWEDQPLWFSELMGVAAAAYSRADAERLNNGK